MLCVSYVCCCLADNSVFMPGSTTVIHLDMVVLRHYFRTRQPRHGLDVLRDAAVLHEPGAKQLVLFALQLRANRRSRRTFAHVVAQARLRNHPTWYSRLAKTVMGLFQCCRKQCVPMAPTAGRTLPGLSRRHRRALSGHGLSTPVYVSRSGCWPAVPFHCQKCVRNRTTREPVTMTGVTGSRVPLWVRMEALYVRTCNRVQ
jgi:hypothetical protein